ncbi:hypothetical protein [Roseovarius sp. M141]|uniref:hypothetical protein n=1 Tax=Roseovarius sp. M141 TaxID=2583806 RepID=UPI0020CBF7B2|nr:hypothetical protein [Roseovarius sp. M141]MCQ0093149.1 hypothetical protein [Roseovarius sp. M141]
MKTAYARIPRMLLVLCLIWYGPFAMAGTGYANGMLTMEICANGAVETVRIDTGGTSEEPTDDCCVCVGCCHIAGDEPREPRVMRVLHTHEMPLNFTLSGTSLTRISIIRPLPRAPPLAHIAIMTTQDVIEPDHSDTGQVMHCNGRPLSKDADA